MRIPFNPDKVTFSSYEFDVNSDVPHSACLPIPPNYSVPKCEPLSLDIEHAALALKNRRSMYIWGMPGCGKDAMVHAWSYLTRTPAVIRQIQPGADIESWFFTRGFNQSGTVWEEGEVLRALRDGYTTETGRVVPYLFLITDFDRADREQAEYLRLVTDSIQGRISGPAGKVYTVFPGTMVVATANTSGGGDERGRMTSSNPLDASIMDRFSRKIRFNYMSWDDELPIVRSKFPHLFGQLSENIVTAIGSITESLRVAVKDGKIHGEFSHRGLCSILEHVQDISYAFPNRRITGSVIKNSARVWVEGLPDENNIMVANKIVDAHFGG